MAGPVFYDGVAEWSQTAGLIRPYVVRGAVPMARPLNGAVANGDWGYFTIGDSVRFEIVQARFLAPATLDTIAILASSAGGAAVSWPTSGRRIIRMVPQAATSAQPIAEAESTFWLAVAAGSITDLGDLAEAITEAIDMGELIAGADDLLLLLDLGELLSAPADPDDPQFWVAIELGQVPDLGDLDDQVITPVDMSDLAGIGDGGSGEAATMDLGEQ